MKFLLHAHAIEHSAYAQLNISCVFKVSETLESMSFPESSDRRRQRFQVLRIVSAQCYKVLKHCVESPWCRTLVPRLFHSGEFATESPKDLNEFPRMRKYHDGPDFYELCISGGGNFGLATIWMTSLMLRS